MSVDAGWLADPSGAHELRYFDGTTWTDHVSDGGVTSTAPMPAEAGAPPPPPPPAAPAAGGKGGWKDKLKNVAQQAAEQGKAAAEKTKSAIGEQQQKRLEQMKNDPNTLWFGQSIDVTSKATGMSKATYRLTKSALFIDSGMLGTRSDQVPLWAVRDIDVRQNVMQRGKDVGDVVLWLEDPALSVGQGSAFDLSGQMPNEPGMTSGEVVIDNIEGPHQLRDLLMPLVSEARQKKTIERQSQYHHVMNPGMGMATGMGAPAAPPPPAAGPPVDVAEQLRKLASLRDEGILSEEEFAAQKAKLLG